MKKIRGGVGIRWKLFGWLLAGAVLPLASAQYTPAIGPKQYTRTAGPPNHFIENFEHCGTAGCRIVVVNGNADGSDRISSASIFLNGVQILGPSDFNQRTDSLIKPVSLAASNTLEITLNSAPGSFLTVDVECVTSAATLSAGAPGDSLLDPSTLAAALTIRNTGTGDAQNVSAAAITLRGGALTSPTPLPFNLGTIPAVGAAVLNADFSGVFAPSAAEKLMVSGTYTAGGATYCFDFAADFTIPKAAPGSSPLHYVQVTSNSVSGGGFPPGTNGNQGEDDSGNWTVPIGPLVAGTPSAPTGMTLGAQTAGDTAFLAPLATPSVVFTANKDMYASDFFPGAPRLGQNCGMDLNAFTEFCAEPSGAGEPAGTIFATANWLNVWSTDGGTSFHPVDPHKVFPDKPIGFCCDQIVQYAPTIDRFIWLIQGCGASCDNDPGFRLAVSSTADIGTYAATAWTYWDLPAKFLASPFNNASPTVDFPDLSIGNNYLYLSWNLGPVGCTCDVGHQVARIPLTQLRAGGSIQIGITDPADDQQSWGGHLTQDTLDAIYWAGHKDSSHLRVFSMKESDDFYSWQDVQIASYATSGLSSKTPDGRDWMQKLSDFPKDAVLGATRVADDLWFAWTAGTDSNFPQPHIEMAEIDRNSFNLVQQVQIWNSNLAFGYPALATNLCTGEVGLSLVTGGNGNFENHAVGIWGDFSVFATTNSNVGANRFGDFSTIRQAAPTLFNPGNLFLAFGYGIRNNAPLATGVATSVRYVLFGRPAEDCLVIP